MSLIYFLLLLYCFLVYCCLFSEMMMQADVGIGDQELGCLRKDVIEKRSLSGTGKPIVGSNDYSYTFKKVGFDYTFRLF